MPPLADAPVRVLVIAADPLARSGLSGLLADAPELQVVGQTGPAEDLVRAADVYQPDVILWDFGWQRENEIEQAADLLGLENDNWAIPVLALLGDAEAAPTAWSAGMRSLILRTVAAPALTAALVATAAGMSVLDPELAAALISRRAQTPLLDDPLTPREHEVLQLMAEGDANKTIARRLQISEHTVKFHVNSILNKLGVQSRTEAVVLATRSGLITL